MNETEPLSRNIQDLLEHTHSLGGFSAGRCLILHNTGIQADVTIGQLAVYDDELSVLPLEQRVATTTSTMFDLASLTKVFSAYTLLAMALEGILDLDRPLAEVLPAWREGDKKQATLRHLLTHTAGLPPSWDGWRQPLNQAIQAHGSEKLLTSPIASNREELEESLLHTALESTPGTRRQYSDVSFNTAMILAERVTGQPWPTLVDVFTVRPLGLNEVTYSPDPSQTAATEYMPELHRGVVQGYVHDETSWALGSGCANAGLFASANAVARFAQILHIGSDEPQAHLLWDDQLETILGRHATFDQDSLCGASLGLQIGAVNWMGHAGAMSRGHTGFTGTSFQIDRETGLTIVLLTNRVHPSRTVNMLIKLRCAIANAAFDWVGSL